MAQEQRIRPEEIARVVVRPLGSVLPLGFLAFGTGIFVTAAYGLGWIPPEDGRDVFLLVLVFVTPIEAVTSVLAYLARDTAGGTTLGVFAGTWATLGTIGLGLQPGQTSTTPPLAHTSHCSLKSARHLVSICSKNQADYVTRRFNASLAGLKKPVGLIFAGTPLNAISKFN